MQENGITPEAAGCKVFVGNLSYEVTSEKLSEFFGSCGKVTDVIAVKRYGRPAGYGFVTFESEKAADKAVALKDAELEGRAINVQKAVPREDLPERARGRGRGRRGRGGRGGRGGSRRSEPPTGEPSTTTLFVGNLPFNVIDEDLNNIFAEFGVESARVVRMFDGASRGFGFVTLKNEDEQAKALKKLTEVWCDDRKLTIRAALSQDKGKTPEKQHEVIIKESEEDA